MCFVAEGITGGGVLETYHCGDITGVALFDVLTLVCVHLKYTSAALLGVLYGVVYVGARLDRTGIYAEEAELSDVRVGHDLECECGERLFVA